MARTLVVGDPLVVLGSTDSGFLRDGALIVEGRTVVEVGSRELIEQHGPFDRRVGSASHVVIPGFVNGHYHSGSALGRGMAQYIFERANVHVHSMWTAVTEEDLYHAVLMNLIADVRGGQTGFVDLNYGRPGLPSFGYEAILQAYDDLGVRVALGIVTRDRNRYVHAADEEFLVSLPGDLATRVRESSMGYAWPVEEVFDVYREVTANWDRRNGRARILLAPDWTPACSDELYQKNRLLADEFDTGIMTHVLETRSEMMFALEHDGKTAMRRLADLGVLGPDVSCAHFVWATDEDIAILADTGSVAVNNPGSNLRLATGIARVRDMFDRGARVCFGTDNISFSDAGDFFQELRLAAYLQRTPGALETGRLESEQLLRAAAENGARAIRFEDELGSLEVGKEADLVVLRRDRLFWPEERYASAPPLDVILDRANGGDVDSVMVAGEVIFTEGQFTRISEDGIRLAVEVAAERLLGADLDSGAVSLGHEVEPYVLDFYRTWARTPLEPAAVYNALVPPSAT
ncbi:MAG: amidohydrolase family protein [Acidimicrobiales bacterium]|nr:amidohydrolase family protein [Acidimicrobiales bacterium]